MGRPKTASLLLILAACLVSTTAAPAGNWPRFRGPNGTGSAADTDIPVQWEDKNTLWKADLPGIGHSSPIVWGERLFLQAGSKDGKERQLLCLNTTDGSLVWAKTIGGMREAIHPKNSFASGTPATDGERVYTAFWDGHNLSLFAHDFKGNQVWTRDLGAFHSQHGAGHSPMIYEDRVILANDQDGESRLIAVDAHTGKDVWSAERKAFRTCYSTPFLHERQDASPELIVASTAGITSYDPKDGKVYWNFTWSFDKMALRTVSSPIFAQGLVIATSGDGSGARHTIAVRAGGKGELGKQALVWENKKALLPYVPSVLTRGDYLYFVGDKGTAACYETKTGKEMWTEHLSAGFSASPVLIDGKVFAADDDGDVYIFAAEPKFQLLARNKLGEPVTATPAVADNRLYIRGDAHLFCIGKPASK